MPHRVQDILLVSSLYDWFIMQEVGQLNELVANEFLDLNLGHIPGLLHARSGEEALALAQDRFNLVISTPNPGDIDGVELANRLRCAGRRTPVVLLGYSDRELADFARRRDLSPIERCFLWQGDVRILLAITKYIEDRLNVENDTRAAGVQVILLIEDNIRYYSSFLPVIYTEVINHSQRLIAEGVNLAHKLLRMRARPKILLCTTFEEAWRYFTTYQEHILGVISDVEFPRGGRLDKQAGVDFTRLVKSSWPDIPVILHSSRPENRKQAKAVDAAFLLKGSLTLLHDLRQLMSEYFSFGDFVFRLPGGKEVGRAGELKGLEEMLQAVPAESIAYHAERNHFSNWLKARTEFALAHRLRPRKVSHFPDIETLRRNLLQEIAGYRRSQSQELIADFRLATFDPQSSFARIGRGSIGGKARGLAFIRYLLNTYFPEGVVDGAQVSVPPAVILASDIFDRFLEENQLKDWAMAEEDDAAIERRFQEAAFPDGASEDFADFLSLADYPLAVRSSSLLEDSQYLPFSGVYKTYLLPNRHPDCSVRLKQLLSAVKRVYASTFLSQAKAHIRATPYRLEEEKMAVIVQKLVGAPHGQRFYPDFAGVARSHNCYPTPPAAADDGIVAVALGLGKTVVEGEKCLHFCPRYPEHIVQFSSVRDTLNSSQREFWALQMEEPGPEAVSGLGIRERKFDLEAAQADGTLAPVASTYSAADNAIYDGTARPGARLVSFAPVLKHQTFPLPEIIAQLLELGEMGMNAPVEIEFAVNRSLPAGAPPAFGFLQMRPLPLFREVREVEIGEVEVQQLICRSDKVLGNGCLENIADVVTINWPSFDRARSREAAQEVAALNAALAAAGRPYLLVGSGRWGSADPWLGIPATWEQISGARVIVEAGFKDFKVTPSQGTHFFQNLILFQVGYFTVNPEEGEGVLDWDWLSTQPAHFESPLVRHLRLPQPLLVKMDGRRQRGVIVKPPR